MCTCLQGRQREASPHQRLLLLLRVLLLVLQQMSRCPAPLPVCLPCAAPPAGPLQLRRPCRGDHSNTTDGNKFRAVAAVVACLVAVGAAPPSAVYMLPLPGIYSCVCCPPGLLLLLERLLLPLFVTRQAVLLLQ